MKTIKTLTLWQPWASLIMIGAKPWEFRSWSYLERGTGVLPGDRIGIHAAARPVKMREVEDLLARLDDSMCSTGLVADKARALLQRLAAAPKCRGVVETGAILGTVEIGTPVLSVDAMPGWGGIMNDSDRLEHCKWAWPMREPRRLEEPLHCSGYQQFWNWRASI